MMDETGGARGAGNTAKLRELNDATACHSQAHNTARGQHALRGGTGRRNVPRPRCAWPTVPRRALSSTLPHATRHDTSDSRGGTTTTRGALDAGRHTHSANSTRAGGKKATRAKARTTRSHLHCAAPNGTATLWRLQQLRDARIFARARRLRRQRRRLAWRACSCCASHHVQVLG